MLSWVEVVLGLGHHHRESRLVIDWAEGQILRGMTCLESGFILHAHSDTLDNLKYC